MGFDIGINIKDSRDAVEIYRKAFGIELGYHVLNDDGSYFHSELMKGKDEICSVVEDKDFCPGSGNPIHLGYTFDTKEQLLQAFDLLKDGGHVDMDIRELPWSPCAAYVTDRFGVHWYLTLPGYKPPEDFKPGDEK